MKFSRGHGYAHLKSKEKFARKAWVKTKKKSIKQYTTGKKGNLNSNTIPDTYTIHINKKKKIKQLMHIFSINENLIRF